MPLDTYLIKRFEQIGREMQPGRGRGDSALFAGIDGLVIGLVLRIFRTFRGNIGRQGNMADRRNRLVQNRAGDVEQQRDLTLLTLLLDDGFQMGKAAGIVALMTEPDAVALLDALAGTRESLPAGLVGTHVQRGRNRRLRRAFAQPHAFQLGGNDTGVVEDKRIAGPQERRQVKDAMVLHAVFIRIDDEQARAVARVRRAQGDILLGQIEIEQVYTHERGSRKYQNPPRSKLPAGRCW